MSFLTLKEETSLKKVANDMQRVGQMILVINKMSRETGEKKRTFKNYFYRN